MSGQLGELVVSMQLEMARFREDLGKANRAANDSMTRMAGDVSRSTTAMQRTMSGLAGTMAATFSVAAVVGFTREVTQAALATEKLQMQFKASAGSTAASVRELDYIRKLSDTLGLSFQSTATAYGKFLASTRNTAIEGEKARKVFEGVSEAATALGLSADESSGIFLALSQMMSKGKVSAEELTGQLGERLPGALKLAADSLGLTTAELLKQMQEGKVMSADLLPKLAAELHKTYGTAAEEAAKKGQAGINRFNNEVLATKAAIGSQLMPAINAAAEAMAEMMKQSRQGWGFNPGNLLEPFNSNTPGYNKASRAETFRIPKAGEAMASGGRIQTRLAADAAIGSTIDPQMARIAADRRAEQDKINASRATAEKIAAGAADRDKAAKSAIKKATQEQAEAQKAVNSGLREQNLLLEAAVKDWDLAGLGSGLLDDPLAVGKPKNPTFSLTGASETMGFNGNDTSPAVAAKEAETKELLSIQQRFNADMLDMQMTAGAAGLDLLSQQFSDNKAMSLVFLAAKKALAIAQILINTEATQSALLLSAAERSVLMPLGTEAFMAEAIAQGAAVRAMGYASIALVTASGAIEAANIDGRATGGPVAGGQTYLVGERGPELFTPGASGQITSNGNLQRLGGGQSVSVTNVFQISTGVSATVQAELGRMMPAIEARTTNAVKRAINGGTDLSTAVGRM